MPSNARELFGQRVRALRLGKKLSQEKLAELCGLHRNYPGRIERAELDLSFSYAMKLSVGLGVKPMEMFKLIPKLSLADIQDAQPKKKEK